MIGLLAYCYDILDHNQSWRLRLSERISPGNLACTRTREILTPITALNAIRKMAYRPRAKPERNSLVYLQ